MEYHAESNRDLLLKPGETEEEEEEPAIRDYHVTLFSCFFIFIALFDGIFDNLPNSKTCCGLDPSSMEVESLLWLKADVSYHSCLERYRDGYFKAVFNLVALVALCWVTSQVIGQEKKQKKKKAPEAQGEDRC